MYYGHTQRVEANQTQHSPVKALGLDQTANGEANPLLFPPEVRRVLVLALHAGPGKRRPWGGSWNQTHRMAIKLLNLKLRLSHQIKTVCEWRYFEAEPCFTSK